MKFNVKALQAGINNLCSRFLFTGLDIIGIILMSEMNNQLFESLRLTETYYKMNHTLPESTELKQKQLINFQQD